MASTSVASGTDHLIFDLTSSERQVRLAAIFQLGTRLEHESVRQALIDHQNVEDDPEVAWFLQQSLARADVQASDTASASSTSESIPDWKSLPPTRYDDLLEPLRHSKPEARARCIVEILDTRPTAILLEKLLELGSAFPFQLLDDSRLRGLLFHPNPGVAVRTLYLAGRQVPERSLPFLPDLLQRPSLLIRAFALRLLYRYVPDQALRLLEEFLDHPDQAQRGVGIGLLFQFPFEDVAGAVLRLIESQRIPRNSEELVFTLVRSNPNSGFASRLAVLERNHPDRPGLGAILEAAADALMLSGLDPGPLPALCRRLRTAAEQEIARLLKSPSDSASAGSERLPAATEAPASDSVAPSGPVSSGTRSSASPEPTVGALAEVRDQSTLLRLVLPLAERRERGPELAVAAFQALHRLDLAEPRLVDWGVSLLERSPEVLLLPVIRYLERHAIRRLSSHLPLLAFHDSAFVASQAVRILRRQEGTAFFRRLDAWLRDPDPRALRAGLAGLLQIDFNRARALVMTHLRSTTRQEVLDGLADMVRMNPDHRLINEIQLLANTVTTTKRRAFLLELAVSCQRELARLYGATGGDSALARLKELWAEQIELRLGELVERLRVIHFSPTETLQENPGWWLRTGAVTAGILAILFSWHFRDSPFPSSSADTRSLATSGSTVARGTGQTRFLKPTTVIGTLEAFDPLTRYWKFRTSDGGVQKLRFPEASGALVTGRRLSVDIVFLGTSPLGYNLYAVRQYQTLHP